MDACCSRFTAAEGGARLAAVAAERNTLAVEYSAFIATRLLHEDAYKIRGLLSEGYQRSVYVTRASRAACVAYELHILTDLTGAKAVEHPDVGDWSRELEEKQVLVCTSQVLKWILQEDILSIPQINVLIIDSCHLIFEDENLQYIMKRYKEYKESEQPRILALTYPLFTSKKEPEPDTTDSNTRNILQDNDTENRANSISDTGNNLKDKQNGRSDGFNINKDSGDVDTDVNVSKDDDLATVDEGQYRIIELCDEKIGAHKDRDGKDKGISFEKDNYEDCNSGKDDVTETSKVETGKDKETSFQKDSCEDSSSNDKDDVTEITKVEMVKEKELGDEKKDIDKENEKNEGGKSVDEKKDDERTEKCEESKDTNRMINRDMQVNKTSVDNKDTAESEVGEKISKVKKHVKCDESIVSVQENLDDFDMYQKLEWKIERLEQALCCQMDLAEDIDGGKRLANTVAKPKEVLIEYRPQAPLETMPGAYVELQRYMREAVASAKAFMDEHRYDPTEIYGDELYEEFMNIPDPTIEPKLMFNQFLYVLDQLGPYAADKAAFSLLVKLEKLKIKVPYERHFLLLCLCTSVFVKIRCQADLILSKYDDWERIRLFSTPKMLRFAEILEQFQTPEQIAKAREKVNDNNNRKKESDVATVDSNIKSIDVDENFALESKNVRDVLLECSLKYKSVNQYCSAQTELGNDTQNDVENEIESKIETKTGLDNTAVRVDSYENSEDKNYIDFNSARNQMKVKDERVINRNDTIKSAQEVVENGDISENSNSGSSNSDNTQSKLVRSKTIELLDELDKCDFVTLSNKIEDRVNTYKANLKDLDECMVGDKGQAKFDNDQSGIEIKGDKVDMDVTENDEINSKIDNTDNKHRKDLKVDNNSTNSINDDKQKDKNEGKVSENDSNNLIKDVLHKNSNAKKTSNLHEDSNRFESKTKAKITDDNKTKSPVNPQTDVTKPPDPNEGKKTPETQLTKPNENKDEGNQETVTKPPDPRMTLVHESQVPNKPRLDDRLLELRAKQGFRRPHRVRGRGRTHRSHAARLQQMQQNPDALCGIVFIKEPLVAKIMFMIIVDMSRCRPSLSHLCAQYCAVESDGGVPRPQGRKHEDVLKKFRMHECNLLLATSALEEGIDLPRCNLVVRWDLPPSYRSHSLCRSRARAPRSTVTLMAETDAPSETLLDNMSVYRELDQIISRKCGCGIQNEPPAAEEVHADIFTVLVKAYTPNEVKEINETNQEMLVNNDRSIQSGEKFNSNIIENDSVQTDKVILSNDKNVNEAADDKVLSAVNAFNNSVSDNKLMVNDVYSVNSDKSINDICDNGNTVDGKFILKECINGITKEIISTEYIIKQADKKAEAIDTNGKLDSSEISNESHFNINGSDSNIVDNKALNEDLIKNTLENSIEDILRDEKRSDNFINKEADFNITYDLSKKSVCECKSGLCKCRSVSGDKSEVNNKTEKKGEEAFSSVDLSTAIALINRYCGKLPSDTFTRLAPQYWMEEVRLPERRTDELRAAYICTLRLPLNCPVKYNIVGHPMPTKVLARRMVALQACRILHKSGELDNQLMPIGKENFKAAELENVGLSDNEINDSARPGTTKRRQYYYKRTASAFTDCQPLIDSTDADIEQHSWKDAQDTYKARSKGDTPRNTLYALSSRLWCALPERYNTRGRRLHAPQHAPHAVAVLMAARADGGLQIPAFPVYTRSGEVRVSIETASDADVRLSPRRAKLVRRFMRFVFSDVLRVRRRGMRLQTEGTTHNNYYIVPTVKVIAEDGTSRIDIDWSFLELIYKHTEEKKNSVEKPVLIHHDEEDEEEPADKRVTVPKREREKDGKAKRMDNPFLRPGEVFAFDADRYRDAVVTPWYRNQDQPQYFLVAEICWNLTPDSAFPSSSHASFRDYYSNKYGVTLTQPHQPLLDVDHTSARLNLLTPRYVNRKGVALPVSSERTRRAKRDRLDQKQILVPELCTVHPFAAPLWFATVALPCVLYRINALLIADEIRRSVSADVALGLPPMRGVPAPQWPPLDFGWSLAEVLNTDEKGEKKKEDDDYKKGEKESKQKEDKESIKEDPEGAENMTEVKEKTINDILQEKEDAESGFEIGTWSNDMASSVPQEYDEFMEPLPPNLTFCTSASGGANWSDPIDKPKGTFGASKAFSMAESDCSYMSSDFDTDDSDLNSDGSDDEMDSSGFYGRNTYAMGVRIEYKTAHEAEAVDLERKTKMNNAPQLDPDDDALDVVTQRRILREGRPPDEYIEKYNKSVVKHKKDIKEGNLITKDTPINEILPDNSKEMEKLRKALNITVNDKDKIGKMTQNIIDKGIDEDKIADLAESESISESKDIGICKVENVVTSENNLNNTNKSCVIKDGVKNTCVKESIHFINNTSCSIEAKELSKEFDFHYERENINTSPIEIPHQLDTLKGQCKEASTKDSPIKIPDELNTLKDKCKEASTKDIHIKNSSAAITDYKSDYKDSKSELLEEIFPYGNVLDVNNGQVTLESIEKNKRILLNDLKKSLTGDQIKKLNCFSMLDIDIDSPDYINEKVVNVGFDTKDSYVDRVNGFRNAKDFTPYYQDTKVQNAKDFDFDYQPDLEGHPGPSPSVILQALTMSNANDGINLERLETIGDSFLKFAITAYLYCAHPAVHEGKLSHMRSKQVSNLNLYRLGRNKRLGARMIASKFEPHDNWLPPCHKPPPTHHPTSGDQEMQMHKDAATDNAGCFIPYNLITQHSIPDKSIADCVEALIGAYLLECGPRGALLFMSWLGISVLPRHLLPLPPDHPYVRAAGDPQEPPPAPSPKQSYSSSSNSCSSDSEDQSSDEEEEPEELEQSQDCEWSWRGRPVGSLRPRLDENGRWVQTIFGELRAPPSPLLRYVEDPEGELERMLSGYEALERTLQYRFRDRSLLLQALTHASHQQNRLTDCYQRLEFLGDAILDYLITRHLYEDARRHSPGALTDLRSALVNNTIFATLAARHGFHKYFRHMSPGLNEVLTKYVKIQEENGHSISEEHYLIQEDEMEQAEDVEVPKALGDLFESVAGAIFLDSGMSLGAVWASYVRLMGAELEAFSAAAPKSPVRELLEAEPDTAKFGKPERLADGRRVRVCVEVFGRGAFKGVGRNYRIAKGTAARCALRHLRAARPPRR